MVAARPATWGDCVVVDARTGGYGFRCRIATYDRPPGSDPDDELVYPVGADGKNLTQRPIVIETRVGLSRPLPWALGRTGDVVIFPPGYWRPKPTE